MLNKKYQRYFFHAFPFGIKWLVFSMIYALLEHGLLGVLDHYPTTENPYSFKITIQYPVVGSFLAGLL
jgi:adenylate cyclase